MRMHQIFFVSQVKDSRKISNSIYKTIIYDVFFNTTEETNDY